jgi:hypothetical protein
MGRRWREAGEKPELLSNRGFIVPSSEAELRRFVRLFDVYQSRVMSQSYVRSSYLRVPSRSSELIILLKIM